MKPTCQSLMRHRYAVALICLYLFLMASNFLWLRLDGVPLLWDAGSYYHDSLILSHDLSHPSFRSLAHTLTIGSQYPPLVPLLVSLFYPMLTGTEDSAVLIAAGIFLAVLIMSVFGIGRILRGRKTGLLAALLVTMYPIVFAHSRVFMYDLPLAAMVSLFVLVFLLARNFRDRRYSFMLGIVAGLGMLTKFSFLLFAGSAAVYQLGKDCWYVVRRGSNGHGKQLLNLSLAVFIAGILASPWYLTNFKRFVYAVFVYPGTCKEVCAPTFSFASLSYYFFSLINDQLSFALFPVFVFGLFRLGRIRKEHRYMLVFWLLLSYAGCTLVNYKSARYTVPLLPACALVSAIGLTSFRNTLTRAVLMTGVIIVCFIQYVAYSFGLGCLPQKIEIGLPFRSIVIFDQKGGENSLEGHAVFRPGDWKTAEIVEEITRAAMKKAPVEVFVLPDDPRIHSPLVSQAYLKRIPYALHVGSMEQISAENSDMVITKSGSWMTPPYFMEAINRSVKWFEENKRQFMLIRTLTLPDGSELEIFLKLAVFKK